MSKLRIGVIVGSNSQSSINRKLAQALVKLAQNEAEFTFIDLAALPFYNRDDDAAYPAAFQQLKDTVRAQDGILFVTPEHNRSVPALLKNALDGASRPYGTSAWSGIPAAVIGTAAGGPATSMAQQHLRNILAYLNMPTLGQPEAFIRWTPELLDAEGNVGAASHDFLKTYMDTFIGWVKCLPKAEHPCA
ncbi:NADPH-dependent oxidoreductase [Corticibacter populi]|uniref:NADPH-dependent oxidoreductase n=1 Tax=Corticibacter populi TaxID=1550736 RepID=A0A3M6QVG3_9BURK|nr:NAD(P)H-dependent oxidoreductase [Corticibacter populi]RMX06871.1 NADPH-dependent oxidoreductase [Corticibacter populi]RZS31535.1 chromate reductase [Corticibacter populi]